LNRCAPNHVRTSTSAVLKTESIVIIDGGSLSAHR
jgi:hypothetical protein